MVSSTFISKETEVQRKPVELYHFWRDGGDNLYYTSGDVKVLYDSHRYVPATLKRGIIESNNELNATTVTIQTVNLGKPVSDFIDINPIEIYWVSILKLHRDQDPFEANVIFLGQIKNVAFSGVAAEIECVGFEHFLEMPIPQWRFQVTCNHKLFDENCSIKKIVHKTKAKIKLNSAKTQLESPKFGLKRNGYFTGGEVCFKDEHRGIVFHEGNTITLAYKMKNLENENIVDVYPGCDGRAETCRDKFNNVRNGLFFRNIPIDNPTRRTTV